MTLVLDAGVAIKLHVAESDPPAAPAWVERDPVLSAPDIFPVEVAQALLRDYREQRRSRHGLGAAIVALRRNGEVPPTSGELAGRALDLGRRLHDYMHLALADRIGFPLMSADERLARKTAASGVPIAIRLHTDRPR